MQWLPFWVFHGRVHLAQRETQGGSRSAQKQAEAFWQEPRRLFVPAWDIPLSEAREIGRELVERQPVYQAGSWPNGATFTEATVAPEDALKLLEFIIITIEAQRKDWLRHLQFWLEVGAPELWLLPAEANRERLAWLALEV